jgi:1-acyl-sn-glycerol-3-phosphate acyltransferase
VVGLARHRQSHYQRIQQVPSFLGAAKGGRKDCRGNRIQDAVMIVVRSIAFNLALICWLILTLPVMLIFLPFPRRLMQSVVHAWTSGPRVALKWIAGLDFQVLGQENKPSGAALIACKHQSVWETLIFHALYRDAVYVVKKELLSIPLWGWYMRKCGCIPVDRSGSGQALKEMLRKSRAALAEGHQVVIFPEGTRTEPGQSLPYNPGIAALYAMTEAPVVPVALNSGLFWGRRKFLKHPGVITLEFLPPMPPDLDRRVFLAELEKRIETATKGLVSRAKNQYFPKD